MHPKIITGHARGLGKVKQNRRQGGALKAVRGEGDGISQRQLCAMHGGRAKSGFGGGRLEGPGTRLRRQEKTAGTESGVLDPGCAWNFEEKCRRHRGKNKGWQGWVGSRAESTGWQDDVEETHAATAGDAEVGAQDRL